jgi:hypothetical protein
MKNQIYWVSGMIVAFGLTLSLPLNAQVNLEDSYKSFSDWCINKGKLSKPTKLVIEQILSRFPDEKYMVMDRNPLERIDKNAFESSLYPSTNDCKRVELSIQKVESYTHYGTGVRVDVRPFAYFTNIKQLTIEFGIPAPQRPYFNFEKGLADINTEPKIHSNMPVDLKLLGLHAQIDNLPVETIPAKVEHLPLEVMPVVDLKPLSLLTEMEYLHIEGNIPVNDLTPIKSMKKLKYLFINRWIGADKPDISSLRGLSSLLTVFINNKGYSPITLDKVD